MNIAVDTNVLARAILMDDPEQGRTARKLLTDATTIAIPLPCQLVWILGAGPSSRPRMWRPRCARCSKPGTSP